MQYKRRKQLKKEESDLVSDQELVNAQLREFRIVAETASTPVNDVGINQQLRQMQAAITQQTVVMQEMETASNQRLGRMEAAIAQQTVAMQEMGAQQTVAMQEMGAQQTVAMQRVETAILQMGVQLTATQEMVTQQIEVMQQMGTQLTDIEDQLGDNNQWIRLMQQMEAALLQRRNNETARNWNRHNVHHHDDQIRPVPNQRGILPADENVWFPQNTNDIVECDENDLEILIRFYDGNMDGTIDEQRIHLRVLLGMFL